MLVLASLFLLGSLNIQPITPVSVIQTQAPPKIATESIKAAVKRANAKLGMNVQVSFTPSSEAIWVRQLPPNGQSLAVTIVAHSGSDEFTLAINLYPQTVYAQFPGTDRDQRYLEDILFLMLCHEFEHMPTGEGGRGGTRASVGPKRAAVTGQPMRDYPSLYA